MLARLAKENADIYVTSAFVNGGLQIVNGCRKKNLAIGRNG